MIIHVEKEPINFNYVVLKRKHKKGRYFFDNFEAYIYKVGNSYNLQLKVTVLKFCSLFFLILLKQIVFQRTPLYKA